MQFAKSTFLAFVLILAGTRAQAQSMSDHQLYESNQGGLPPLMYNPYQSPPAYSVPYIPPLSIVDPRRSSDVFGPLRQEQGTPRYSTLPGFDDDR